MLKSFILIAALFTVPTSMAQAEELRLHCVSTEGREVSRREGGNLQYSAGNYPLSYENTMTFDLDKENIEYVVGGPELGNGTIQKITVLDNKIVRLDHNQSYSSSDKKVISSGRYTLTIDRGTAKFVYDVRIENHPYNGTSGGHLFQIITGKCNKIEKNVF